MFLLLLVPLFAMANETDYSACEKFLQPTNGQPFDPYYTRYFKILPNGIVIVQNNKEQFMATDGGEAVNLGKPVRELKVHEKPGTNRVSLYELILSNPTSEKSGERAVRFFRNEQGQITAVRAPTGEIARFAFPAPGLQCIPQSGQKSDPTINQLGRQPRLVK